MVDDPLKKLGETFKKARLQNGVSLEDLSDKCRIASHHIENIERGNREGLPEEAYLMGYLNKLAKVLKLKDPQAVMDEYKSGEGQFIVQNILNENHIKSDPLPLNISFLKIYHLYILIALLVVVGIFYLFNSASPDSSKDADLITLSKLEKVKDTKKRSSYGRGEKSLKLSIKEVAWFQVYGIAAGKTLYEGEAYPNVKPNHFEFKDDIGFALASGNAGAFEIEDKGRNFILGKSGELVKWYYPKGAKYEYKQRVKN